MRRSDPGRSGTAAAGVAAVAVALCAFACAPQIRQHSGRSPDLFDKESDRLVGTSRGASAQQAPDVYVRQKAVTVKPAPRANETGSLYNVSDERNWLFTSSGPANVGRYVTIQIAANRAPGQGAAATPGGSGGAAPGATAPSGGAPDAAAAGAGDDAESKELMQALPALAPADAAARPITSFKMRIMHRYENGDVLAMTSRRSASDEAVNEVTVHARIPYDRLASGDRLSTDDLQDVRYQGTDDGERIERESSGWEDEYTLRLSGFDEAKSRHAMELADQRRQLEDARKKVEDRIVAFRNERQQVAKQREELGRQKVETETKVKDLETRIEDQQKTIEEQQAEIQDLKPEDKPGDKKEGGSG